MHQNEANESLFGMILLGNALPSGKFFKLFLSSADYFFKINFFRKILSGIPSECQTDQLQIKPDILSGLIWVQSAEDNELKAIFWFLYVSQFFDTLFSGQKSST